MSARHDTPSTSTLAERYRVLLDIGYILTGTLSPEELYRVIYRETARVLEAAGFYIALYDPATDLATVVFYADRGEERRVEVRYRGSDSSVIRDAKGTVVRDRVQAHSVMVLGEADTEITRSAISTPLRYKGRVIGAISCQSYQSDAYDQEDLELLQGIADVAAIALENAQHVTELKARRLEAERIEEIGLALTSSLDAAEVIQKVIDAVQELLAADAAHVWLFEKERARVAASGGPLALAANSTWELPPRVLSDLADLGRPVLIPSVEESELLSPELKSSMRVVCLMLVPLMIGDRLAGAMSAGYANPRGFSDDEIHIARRLASQASVALANARLHQRLQALSLTDPLTGLPNRRHLQMHLQRELAAARRGRPLTVVLFDLDRFKQYNDTLGHVAGDYALRQVGRVLTREARAMNVVARYGGDEFISVLAGSSAEEGVLHARRIAESVSADAELAKHGITLSYGVSQFDGSMTTVDDVIRAADQNLYRFKNQRRAERERTPPTS